MNIFEMLDIFKQGLQSFMFSTVPKHSLGVHIGRARIALGGKESF